MLLSASARLIQFLLLTTALSLPAVHAETIYKCESAGHISYSDKAGCSGKKIDFTVPNDERKNADAVAGQDKKSLPRAEQEHKKESQTNQRINQQAQRQLAQEQKHSERQQKKCALLAQRQKWAKEDGEQIPLGKNEANLRKKNQRLIQRLQQQFQVQCRQ